jgi:hypothetical protein
MYYSSNIFAIDFNLEAFSQLGYLADWAAPVLFSVFFGALWPNDSGPEIIPASQRLARIVHHLIVVGYEPINHWHRHGSLPA